MKLKFLLLIQILLTIGSIQSKRIAGGNEASLGSFPFHAMLESSNGVFRRLCGGALIKFNWILTAGQCLDGYRDVTVRLGLIDRIFSSPGSVMFWVRNQSHMIIYDNYKADRENSIYENDIGLIYLQAATEGILSDNIKTISIPTTFFGRFLIFT